MKARAKSRGRLRKGGGKRGCSRGKGKEEQPTVHHAHQASDERHVAQAVHPKDCGCLLLWGMQQAHQSHVQRRTGLQAENPALASCVSWGLPSGKVRLLALGLL